ncbi:hypothetical protein [Aeromonas hydrophila]|uniref:hypothetical protein n=1 Tax=Aeromonas hydrophila TaxID=644 RepID=UPI0030CCA4CE
MASTIRVGISDTVNKLNKIRNNTVIPEEQIQLQKIINIYFYLWQQVIYDQLDSTTPAYRDAIKALKDAEEIASDTLESLKSVSEAIESAVKAAKVVGSIIGVVIGLSV